MIRPVTNPDLGIITRAVVAAGLVSREQIEEMKRWSPVLEAADLSDTSTPAASPDEALALINEALHSEGYAVVRETDLEVIHQYAATATRGTLHLEVDDQQTDVEVLFGKTALGEYVIAWHSESIKDAVVNGASFLRDGDAVVFFHDVRELFFGTHKAFMVCIPAEVSCGG